MNNNPIKNFEFKAKVNSLKPYETLLKRENPRFIGEDHQIDTYFNTDRGRLKLREGKIENALIEYYRKNKNESKTSDINLYKHEPDSGLKKILKNQFGVKTVVDKKRKIYFINHIKFHFDVVKNLGTFIEVEVIDETGKESLEKLKAQCDNYFDFFHLEKSQLQAKSYSDMMLEIENKF
jgi:predicted adenylyl cyclase CyaB